jgi:nondiscriminating aspartyl-tRNA synthetase
MQPIRSFPWSSLQPSRVPAGRLREHVGSRVRLSGFVLAVRDQKRMQFVILRDSSGLAQITHGKAPAEDSLSELISTLTTGSAVSITGFVVDAPAVKLGRVEVRAEAIEVHGPAATPLPIADDSSHEKLMDWRVLSLRRPDQSLIFEIQTTLEHAMRAFWRAHGFVEIHSPKLMSAASESGAEVFNVAYFGRQAYLAQSPQFYKQMAIAGGLEHVFEIGPAFRAEPSFTTRHETEFTSIDMEVAWIESHEDLMRLEEHWLAYVFAEVHREHRKKIREIFGVELRVPAIPFPRVSAEEARAILASGGHKSSGGGRDLDSDAEQRLAAHVLKSRGHDFVFVTNYPAERRAFYHMRHEDRPDLTKGFDLLWKGIEITTGAQREHRYDRLLGQARERGYALEPLQDYLDFFRYGCPPHGGMGIGLARLLMLMLQRQNVREVILLSRTPNRLTP